MVKTVLSEVGDQVKALVLPNDVKNQTLSSYSSKIDSDKRDIITKAPAVNFASYHIRHTGPANKDDEPDNDSKPTKGDDPIVQLYNDVLAPVDSER